MTPVQIKRAAQVVFESYLPGATDPKVAKKFGITRRSTIGEWRRAVERGDEPELAAAVQELRDRAEATWFEGLGRAVAGGIDFLQRAYREADHRSPDAIRAVTESLSTLVEAEATWRAVNARIARQAGQPGSQARQAAAGRAATIQ